MPEFLSLSLFSLFQPLLHSMSENSPVLDENTLQLYRDYVGITDPHELKHHLTRVQSILVKVNGQKKKSIFEAFTNT